LAVGHSQREKAASRQRILEIASARLRESGAERPAIGELMKAANLTHGGFYRHFESREALVDEAIEGALADGAARLAAAVAMGREQGDPFAAMVDAYLSEEHRDRPADSCAVATLAADVARGSDRSRAAYTLQVTEYLRQFEELRVEADRGKRRRTPEDEAQVAKRRRQALLDLSALVGALLISRAVDSTDLSEELIEEVAAALKERDPRR
jgi:TetR/AcrR family transcriptional repressor of nem operon